MDYSKIRVRSNTIDPWLDPSNFPASCSSAFLSTCPDHNPSSRSRRLESIVCSYCKRPTYKLKGNCKGCGAPLSR